MENCQCYFLLGFQTCDKNYKFGALIASKITQWGIIFPLAY